ncbi:MAG: NAD-glutamate dehydrogenase, partial [Mariprofundaceae bacterium]
MRYLRPQLIKLLDQARLQHRLKTMQPRLMAALTHDFLSLLPVGDARPSGKSSRIALCSRTLTHGNLHRHILTIRCPDQAFYLDAIKGYLIRNGIQPIGQQTMVARMSCDENFCNLELREPDTNDEDNFMFIALHVSATLTPDRAPLHRDIQAILEAVDLSVRDFEPMRRFVAGCSARLMADDADAAALLEWMNDNRYLYFGLQSEGKRLGLCRNRRVFNRIVPHLADDIAACKPPDKPGIAWLSLTASQHYLYSAASIEVVRVCWRTEKNKLEHAVIIGHFSRSARFANTSHLPVLSAYWRNMAADPLLQHSAFYRRELRTLFDRMPNRILLSTKPSIWLEPLKEIIDMADPQQSVAHWLPSLEGNMDTLLVSFAAERFGPKVMQRLLAAIAAKDVDIHGYDSFGIGTHRIILIAIGKPKQQIDTTLLNKLVQHCIIFWKDIAKADVLHHTASLNIPEALRELEALPPLYQDLFPPAQFARDLEMRQLVHRSKRIRVRIHPREESIDVHIYSREQPSLGRLVDTLRAFGLDPVQEWLVPFGKSETLPGKDCDPCTCIYISTLTCKPPRSLNDEDQQRLRRALAMVLNQEAD